MKHILKNILPYVLTAGLLLLGSCAKQLDLEPVDTIDDTNAVATSGDVEALLVGAYDALGDADVLGGNIQRDADLLGDDGEIFSTAPSWPPTRFFAKTCSLPTVKPKLPGWTPTAPSTSPTTCWPTWRSWQPPGAPA